MWGYARQVEARAKMPVSMSRRKRKKMLGKKNSEKGTGGGQTIWFVPKPRKDEGALP